MAIRGFELLETVVGRSLSDASRFVLSLGEFDTGSGHGITVLSFGDHEIVVSPGPNEDYIVIEPMGSMTARIDKQNWMHVPSESVEPLQAAKGKSLSRATVYSDGVEDVALVLELDGKKLVFALVDTDLIIADGLDCLKADPEIGQVRSRLDVRA